jgi:signal transduction histidine kinase
MRFARFGPISGARVSGDRVSAARGPVIATGRGALLALLSLVLGLPLFISAVFALAYSTIGIGILFTPPVMLGVRRFAEWERRRALDWSGVQIVSPYRRRPDTAANGALVTRLRIWWWIWRDPATWRDMAWLITNVPAGLVLGLLPVELFAGSFEYLPLVPFMLVLAPLLARPCLRVHALFSAVLLSPAARGALSARVGVLTQSRSEVLDSSAAELRRIERDLHDGAQTRIAALGLDIGLAEQLVHQDPDAAVALLAEARESSGQALAELRSLVRGILPPVLAERGLDGAIRALTLTPPTPVELELDLPTSIPAPIESALYFAVAEAFANAVKHSGAPSLAVRVWLDEREMLVARVRDEGRGGAYVSRGGGLDGIQRRLAAFDGTLTVHSPVGGPTTVTMELPCASC